MANGNGKHGGNGKIAGGSGGESTKMTPPEKRWERQLWDQGARRWNLDKDSRDEMIFHLRKALRDARSPREIAMVTRVLAQLESQNLADEHLLHRDANPEKHELLIVEVPNEAEFLKR